VGRSLKGSTGRMQGTVISTAIPAEIAKFDSLAAQWWDPRGPMGPLHAMNPVRVGWILARMEGSRVLDIGCGAGLASEALARAGKQVVGLDEAPAALAAARAHAEAAGLPIDYRQGGVDQVADLPPFDAVVALEVVEHVADVRAFLADALSVLRPGGRLFLSTLNRTPRSLLIAKFGAEYVARLLPVGTHDWKRFLKPAELAGHARAVGALVTDIAGMAPAAGLGDWAISRDVGQNYIAMAIKG